MLSTSACLLSFWSKRIKEDQLLIDLVERSVMVVSILAAICSHAEEVCSVSRAPLALAVSVSIRVTWYARLSQNRAPRLKRSSLRRVGGSGTTCGQRVDGSTSVLWHVVVGHGACDLRWRVPDEDGALRASCHDELLVWRDGDLSQT